MPVALGYFLAIVSRGMQGRQPGFRNLVLWFSSEQASRALLTGFAILVMALSLVLTMSRSGIMACAELERPASLDGQRLGQTR
ncbi:MAG: hypothetical protein Q7J25_03770 [Vicinamibacterales bacterium]|nr:hypothetical protein [Vicinamibacterales bacterium]